MQAQDLRGFDTVGHVAAISNDPPGNLNPDCADVINGAQPEVDATT